MGFVVYNIGTQSCVSHTESSMGVDPYDMVWETRKEAYNHAMHLTTEYGFSHPHLPKLQRTWAIRVATAEQVQRAKFVGAFGEDYGDKIGTGQTRAHIMNPGKIPEMVEEINRAKVEEFGKRHG